MRRWTVWSKSAGVFVPYLCAKLVKENGEEMMWIRKEGAETSMQYLLASKLVVPQAPEQSLLLRKPQAVPERKFRSRSAFPITDSELALIAAAAIIGERTIPSFG